MQYKWKRGEVNPETGLVFYRRRYKPRYEELWYTQEKYDNAIKNLKNIYRDRYSKEKYQDIYYRDKQKILDCSKRSRAKLIQDNPLKVMLRNLKASAKERGLVFELDLDFVTELYNKQNGKCHFTGINLIKGYNTKLPEQMSIDRLDNTIGYLKDNVVFCCYAINIAKKNYPLEIFYSFINKIKENES